MPDLEKRIEAHKWAATVEAGENVPFEHELFTRNVVVQAIDEEGRVVHFDHQVISDTRLQLFFAKKVKGAVTVVAVG